jgi:spermidine synthase
MAAWRSQTHVLADLWDCSPEVLADVNAVRAVLEEAAHRAHATVVDSTFHEFPGGGVTGVVAVKESHLTIHTWPERAYAAVDIFLCGRTKPSKALAHIVEKLRAQRTTVQEHLRGDPAVARPGPAGDHRPARRYPLALLYGLTLVVAMCSIVYELLLAQTLSALLGNTVLRYSITVGCYLGALGLGALLCARRRGSSPKRLLRIELGLSALGGLSVPLFYFLDSIQRYVYLAVESGSMWETLAPALYLLATHGIILGIGLLSGYEIPLLLELGEELEPGSTNKVLGVDYFGSLVGSVLFPLVFLRSFGLLVTGFAIALVNAAAALVLLLWRRPVRQGRLGVVWGAVAACLVGGLVWAAPLEQYFLKQFYYVHDYVNDADGLADLFRPDKPEIARVRSPYQTIDLVRQPWGDRWAYALLSDRQHEGYPPDLWLYLDREYQFLSGMEELYHEWFVHAPVQASQLTPRTVLILGGGDGLALREVLKYPVEHVVHVDIDPEMLRLARSHPWLVALNGGAHQDPRVVVARADAMRWLRTTRERFDAIYIDMPFARDYNLSLVYSREFYGLVRQRLEPWGFVAIDTPGAGACSDDSSLWPVYYNTIRAAGFETVLPLMSRVDTREPRLASAVAAVADELPLSVTTPDGRALALDTAQKAAYLHGYLQDNFDSNIQEFVLAFPAERAVNTSWLDLDVPLHVFRPGFLPLAFQDDCPRRRDPGLVNSIARPTLPELALFGVGIP